MIPVRKIKNQITCIGLRGWMYLRRSPLKLHAIAGPDFLFFSDNLIDLTWQVSGCYKIVINKRFTLPGYLNRVQLKFEQVPDVLEIQFFGYRERLKRSFGIRKIKASLKSPVVTLPVCRNKIKPEHAWPQLHTRLQLKTAHSQTFPAIRQQSLQLPCMPQIYLPVLHMQLEPYPLQLNQPDYETTVL